MKLAFIRTGSLKEVDMVAEQIRKKQVKAIDVEKPVTRQMLAEIYKWDQSRP